MTIYRLALLGAGAWLAVSAAPIELRAQTEAAQTDATEAEPSVESDAGSQAVELAPITVYATRSERQVLDVPANVSVIPRETLEREMITDMDQVTRYQPGVSVERQTTGTDPFNSFGGFTIRGVGGNRVQMLVDGSRVPERITDGTRDYLDFGFLRSVDIVRGPGSVLWGSDALGGIVALETIDPEDLLKGEGFGGQFRSSYGSVNNAFTNSAAAAYRLTPDLSILGGYGLTIANEYELSKARDDGGVYGCPRNVSQGASTCGELDPTDIATHRGLAKAVWTPNADHRVELSADVMLRTTDVDQNYVLGDQYSTTTGLPTGEYVDDKGRKLEAYRYRFGLEHDWDVGASFLDNVKWSIAYAPQGYERSGVEDSTSAGGDDVVTYDSLKYSEQFFEADLQFASSFDLGPTAHRLTYGFDGDVTLTDYEREDVEVNNTTGVTTVSRAGGFNFANATTVRADLFVQDEIELFDGRLELIPGARYATYHLDPRPDSDYQVVAGAEPTEVSSQELTLKFGAIAHLDNRFSLYGQYGEGFKMPTAQQLYTSLDGAFFDLVPAPDLRPESVKNYEVGLRGQFDRAWFSTNMFYADYDDFIQSFYNPPGTTDYTYRNLSKVKLWGVEASAQAEIFENLTADVSLTWQEGRQQTSAEADETAFDAASPLTAVAGVRYEIPEYDLGFRAVGTFAKGPEQTASDSTFTPGGYAVFDLYADWEIVEGVQLTGAALNITDKRYFAWPMGGSYGASASNSVALSNPIELQTESGMNFRVGLNIEF